VHAVHAVHAVHTRYTRGTHAVHTRYTRVRGAAGGQRAIARPAVRHGDRLATLECTMQQPHHPFSSAAGNAGDTSATHRCNVTPCNVSLLCQS
jgi:hypothetical protein